VKPRTVLYERNELEEAAGVQQLGVELAEKVGDMPRVALYICLGQTRLAQGRMEEADEVMLKSDEVARRNSVNPAFRNVTPLAV
jgi:hypothetical protein